MRSKRRPVKSWKALIGLTIAGVTAIADEVFTIGYKIDSSGVEGDAEAAGKAAKEGFEKGFGTLDLKTPLAKSLGEGGGQGPLRDQLGRFVSQANTQLGGIKLPPLGGESGENPFAELLKRADETADKIDASFGKIGKLGPGGGEGPGERIAKGSETAVKALDALRAGMEGIAGVMAGGGLATGIRSLGEFAEKTEGAAKAGGLIGSTFEKAIPVISAVGATIATGATASYEMTEKGLDLRGEMEALAKTTGVSTEQFVKFRELMAGGGVNLDEYGRGLANLSVRLQGARAAVEKQVAVEPLDTADAQARVTESILKRKDATDQLADAQDRVVGAKAEVAAQQVGGREEVQIAEARGPLTVAGARLQQEQAGINLQQAQFRLENPLAPPSLYIEQQQRELNYRAAINAKAEADLNARQAEVKKREDDAVRRVEGGAGGIARRELAGAVRREGEAERGVPRAEEGVAAAGRAQTRAEQDQLYLPLTQIGKLAESMLTGRGPDITQAQPGLLLPALVKAGESQGGGLFGALSALQTFARREPESQALQSTLREIFPRTDPREFGGLINVLKGPKSIAESLAEPLSPAGKLLSSPELLGEFQDKQKLHLARQEEYDVLDLESAHKQADFWNKATAAGTGVLGAAGPLGVQAFAGGAGAAGVFGLGRLFGFFGGGAATGAAAGAVEGGAAAAGGAAAGGVGAALAGLLAPEIVIPALLAIGAYSLYKARPTEPEAEKKPAEAPPPVPTPEAAAAAAPAPAPAPPPGIPITVERGGAPTTVYVPPEGQPPLPSAAAAPVVPTAAAPPAAVPAVAAPAGGQDLSGAAGALNGAAGALSGAAGALSGAAGALASSAHSAPPVQAPPVQAPAPPVQEQAPPVQEQAEGGLIHGSGDDVSDSIPIMASPHEYIVNARQTRRLGVPFLDKLNRGEFAMGGLIRLAEGGPVTDASDQPFRDPLAGRVIEEPSKRPENPLAKLLKQSAQIDKAQRLAERRTQRRIHPHHPHHPHHPQQAHHPQPAPAMVAPDDGSTPDAALFDDFATGGLIQRFASGGLIEQAIAAGVSLSRSEMGAMSDEDLQTEINRARLFSVPASVLAALGRGTMADVRLLNQGFALVGQGAITAAELAAHVVKAGWQDWLQQTMREAPHAFHVPEPPAPPKPPPTTEPTPSKPLPTPDFKMPTPPHTPTPRSTVSIEVQRHGDEGIEPEEYAVPRYTPEMEAIEKARGFTYQGGPDIDVSKPEQSRFADIDVRSEENKAADAEEAAARLRATSPHRGPSLETRFEDLPLAKPERYAIAGVPFRSFSAAELEGEAPAPSRSRRRDASDESMWDPDRGLALGGLVRARVSNGEYRMGASAVSRLGVGFMEALNAGRFAEGGIVAAPAYTLPPALMGNVSGGMAPTETALYAATARNAAIAYGNAGLGGGLLPLPSQIPGLPREGGAISTHTLDLLTHAGTFSVDASAETIAAMRASAIGDRLTSTGVKPSWY